MPAKKSPRRSTEVHRRGAVRTGRDRALPIAGVTSRRLQEILDNTTAVIYVKDRDGRYALINRRYEEIFHVDRTWMCGRTDRDLFPAATARAFRVHDEQVLASNAPIEVEERVPQDDGEHLYISLKFPLLDEQGRPDAVCGISTDITERRHAEAQVQRLAQSLVQARDEEREQIGSKLHDSACQELVAVGLSLELVRRSLADVAEADKLGRACAHLNRTVDQLRDLARELRPALLHDLGLAEGLRTLASGFATVGLTVDVRVPTRRLEMAADVEVAVYRIAQEALQNTQRHAHATQVRLRLVKKGAHLTLTVQDNGRGFDLRSTLTAGLGITGMQQRALAVGGRLAIDPTRSSGTTVTFNCRTHGIST